MNTELKIKSKHLSLEPAIIRCEEAKLKKQIRWAKANMKETSALSNKLESLTLHRKNEVRNEARATLLARTYLKGQAYSLAEKKRKTDKEGTFQTRIIPRIAKMASKYGPSEVAEKTIVEWSKI
jgi:hypothetical protein